MRVGILTRSRGFNYGAVLQAYAMKEAIGSLGHEGCVVDYWTASDLRAARSLFQQGMKPKTLAHDLLILAHYHPWRRRFLRFDQFRRDYLNLSPRRYTSDEELAANPPPCKAFVCGSDQVWNPLAGVNPVYFLRFAKALGARRIAYAPSFGAPTVPEPCRRQCAEFIADIPFLSSREERGCQIIKELTGRDAKVVVDPVLLLSLEAWKSRFPVSEPPRHPYILVYCVRTRKAMSTLVRNIRKKTGLPLVLVTGDTPLNRIGIPADTVVWDAGPKEFVELAMGAACVCTNSFHGTAFALVFRKPLYVVQHTATDSRMTNLMERAGMARYVVRSEDYELPKDPLGEAYESAGPALEALREQSLGYLRTALDSPDVREPR